MKLPRRVVIEEVRSGRYRPGTKPILWDERIDGVDQVRTRDGEDLSLVSGGAQATPAPGWELLLTHQSSDVSGSPLFEWTLYGIHKQ